MNRAAGRAGGLGASSQLARLLAMVPWLLDHQGASLSEAAAHFEVGEQQVIRDLELLFVCGTPGHLPDDLIEADWESGRIYLRNADAIARPLRLSLDEAVALLVGLRALAEVPGLHDRDLVESVVTKLSAAAGDGASAAASLSVDLSPGAVEPALRATREALRRRRQVFLTYVVPSRDETTRRIVDPIRLITVGDRWYLEGWCHRAEAVRRFRLDRVAEIEVLDEAANPPTQAGAGAGSGRGREAAGDGELFRAEPEDLTITLELTPDARWVAEYYPVEDLTEREDGSVLVRMRSASLDWPARLVLRLAGGARVLGPAELADRVRELARQGLSRYQTANPTG